MNTRMLAAKITAIAGSVLLLFPVAFMLVISIPGSIMRGSFIMDFLIPAELGLFVLIGALLLLAGAILGKRQVKLVAIGIGLLVLTIVGWQLLAIRPGYLNGC